MKLSPVLLLSSLLTAHVSGYKIVHRPKEEKKDVGKTTEEVKPWVRTIYGTKVEIVTPIVIDGITFSAKPPPTPNPLQPWVSLNKEGRPKTIRPEIKNGHTRRASPDYSTYFKTASIRTYGYEELKAHNMDPNDIYEEEVFIDEDKTYLSLNPVIRCTPDRYFNKGLAKDIPSEPFCTPRENSRLKVGVTYFITWYTRFFEDEHSGKVADKVRVHLSYVKERLSEKGRHKRDIPATFFSSEWIENVDGMYPIKVDQEWLQGFYERRIVISVQPSYIPDEEFNPLQNGVLTYIILGARVFKKPKTQLTLEDSGLEDEKWYYVALSIPTVIVVVVVIMYIFLQINSSYRDFSDVTRDALNRKRRVIGKLSSMKKYQRMKNHKYSELPTVGKLNKQQ